ncbi:ankyrin repeat protein [Legionella sainthelensi]|uniref:Ankyrin repeat protein n=1 Tax=Legionella sainthelensi TaxID=28087 RepID=A0A0W0YN70_9GAMM|nr:ankyrin repeat domain-containing protein [Legionella sainthelensi]KTD58321.1 ankyrin repeat protein [Legionella sainthelensi]VEH27185.1 ankyrin repeat protein [Legionella sainthelensi]
MEIKTNMNLILKAVEIGQIGVVRALILEGRDVNEFSQGGNCPLLEAASRNDSKIVALLLQHGANPMVEDPRGQTPLYWAQRYKNTEMEEMITNRLNESIRLHTSF